MKTKSIQALLITLSIVFSFGAGAVAETYLKLTARVGINPSPAQRMEKIKASLFPAGGHKSKIALKDAVLKMVEGGVIDPVKFAAVYEQRGGLPPDLAGVLESPSETPIALTEANANIYLNLLWPLGLSNTMVANEKSPINGENLHNFAATGGWTLAKEGRGGDYFNKIAAVPLTPEQEAMVVSIAENVFRPCCGNSTFFQDCNHGSALLGLLQLGAAQGLTEQELYGEALAFNTYWFPDNYAQTALYFKIASGVNWTDVEPQVILSRAYSSGAGWRQNIATPLAQLQQGGVSHGGGASCGV